MHRNIIGCNTVITTLQLQCTYVCLIPYTRKVWQGKYSFGQYTNIIVTLRYWIYTVYITQDTFIPILHFLWLRGGNDVVNRVVSTKHINLLVWQRLISTYNQLLQVYFGLRVTSSLTTEAVDALRCRNSH